MRALADFRVIFRLTMVVVSTVVVVASLGLSLYGWIIIAKFLTN